MAELFSLAQLATPAPVLGPDSIQMSQLRSIAFCANLAGQGIGWPETSFTEPEDDPTNWLIKSLKSAGGIHVHAARLGAKHNLDNSARYWQRRIAGRVLGVTWLLQGSSCRLLGVTQSFDQHDWPGPSEFIYRGSCGPIETRSEQHARLVELGQRVIDAIPSYRGYLQAM